MTYTFKLARRLAVSRTFTMLPVLLVLVACNGSDTMAPQDAIAGLPESGIYGWRPRESAPVAVFVNPSSVTVETNQLIQFRARGRNRAGDDIVAPVSWSTTGGTILPDGRFSAAAIGTYQVMGHTRTRNDGFVVDTSIVTVVRRQLGLAAIEITPDTVTLNPRSTQSFSAVGRLPTGGVRPIGVIWTAAGGSVDPAGSYVAGDTAGTYLLIATNTAGTLADTATITIAAPPSLPPPSDSAAPAPPTIPISPTPPPPEEPPPAEPPPAEPPPPATPVLAKVILKPWSVTLATNTKTQFTAFGRSTTGDSMAINVTFSATGGTVTPTGLYTAGSVAGSFRVIANADGLADTSGVTVTIPAGSGSSVGIPFGPFSNWSGTTVRPNSQSFTLSQDAVSADIIIDRINIARSRGIKLILAMTGGKHTNYMTNGVFDMAKWTAKMNTFNTAAIKAAVAAGVADGTIVGNDVMDEPNASGIGDGNTWGPAGTMTKARVDSLASYVKAIFPTLPTGVSHKHHRFEPTKSYRVIDYINDQYDAGQGDVTAFRDAGLALARRDGHTVVFSINLLDGGSVIPGCPIPETGGPGTYGVKCRVTPAQLEQWGLILGSAGCGLTMWVYDDVFMASPDNQRAFKTIADRLATLPAKPCRRS
jgi:hypothetical protein